MIITIKKLQKEMIVNPTLIF